MIDSEDFEKISYKSADGNTMDVFRDSSEDLILGILRQDDGGFKAKVFEAAFFDDLRELGSITREVEFHNYKYALKYIHMSCRVVFPEGNAKGIDSDF